VTKLFAVRQPLLEPKERDRIRFRDTGLEIGIGLERQDEGEPQGKG
jgi:hypothetical protein